MEYSLIQIATTRTGKTIGLCGSGFSLKNEGVMVSAYHVLNKESFVPDLNKNETARQNYLIGRDGSCFQIEESNIDGYPDIDTTLIKNIDFNQGYITGSPIDTNGSVMAKGHDPSKFRDVVKRLLIPGDNVIKLTPGEIQNYCHDVSGSVIENAPMIVNKNDVKLSGINGIRLSLSLFKGMSGGPVCDENNHVIGMLSWVDPLLLKDNTWAVSISEILKKITKTGLGIKSAE